MTALIIAPVREQHVEPFQVPLSRVVKVELRKMFDTRSLDARRWSGYIGEHWGTAASRDWEVS